MKNRYTFLFSKIADNSKNIQLFLLISYIFFDLYIITIMRTIEEQLITIFIFLLNHGYIYLAAKIRIRLF